MGAIWEGVGGLKGWGWGWDEGAALWGKKPPPKAIPPKHFGKTVWNGVDRHIYPSLLARPT